MANLGTADAAIPLGEEPIQGKVINLKLRAIVTVLEHVSVQWATFLV